MAWIRLLSCLTRGGTGHSSRTSIANVMLALAAAASAACSADDEHSADPRNVERVSAGKAIYERHCASCHGVNLEGQPEWRVRLPNGRMPAPPHDDTGHTWHHADDILFGIIKFGVNPPYGPPGYQSDMPAFGATLADRQVWDVLSYIKSRWSPRARDAQHQIDQQRRSGK
jgi:mono/diheme cytochrome c family protein